MDWKRAIEQERVALMRVVALLGALAGLAECAASRSPAMRGFVLWVLRHAEAAARDFVADGPDGEIASMPAGPIGSRPTDAMRLAASLRALARQIEHEARQMPGICGADSVRTEPSLFGRMPAMRDIAMSMLAASAWPKPHPAPDTS